jgi:hypothetical protein
MGRSRLNAAPTVGGCTGSGAAQACDPALLLPGLAPPRAAQSIRSPSLRMIAASSPAILRAKAA